MELREPKRVKLAGKMYPVAFTYTGKSYISEMTGLTLNEMMSLGNNLRLDMIPKIIWAGLKDGQRRQDKFNQAPIRPFELGWEDVADLMTEEEAMNPETKVFEQIMDVFYSENNTEHTQQKKKVSSDEESEGN